MKTLIKIIRKSIRKNPDAGRTSWIVNTGKEAKFTFQGDKLPEWFNKKNVVIESQESNGTDSHVIIKGIVINPAILPELCDDFQNKRYDLTLDIKNEFQRIHTKTPAPEYLYKYKNTKVRCEECNLMVPINDIEGDEFEDMIIQICPKCQKWNTFDFEYERIEDVVKN